MKLMNYTNYDCFIDGMASSVPLWRSLTLQLRNFPEWKPMPLTFAVAPGKQGDTKTVGGQFEAYMNKRYQENQILNIRLHGVFNGCFSNTTWTGRSYSQCIDQYPVECLLTCLTIPAWQAELTALQADVAATQSRRLSARDAPLVAPVDETIRKSVLRRAMEDRAVEDAKH